MVNGPTVGARSPVLRGGCWSALCHNFYTLLMAVVTVHVAAFVPIVMHFNLLAVATAVML
jgi:hypothetical protein